MRYGSEVDFLNDATALAIVAPTDCLLAFDPLKSNQAQAVRDGGAGAPLEVR